MSSAVIIIINISGELGQNDETGCNAHIRYLMIPNKSIILIVICFACFGSLTIWALVLNLILHEMIKRSTNTNWIIYIAHVQY